MNDEDFRGLFEGLRRHFDVTAEHVNARLATVAEAVSVLDKKLDRRTDALEETVQRTAAETQAMIRDN